MGVHHVAALWHVSASYNVAVLREIGSAQMNKFQTSALPFFVCSVIRSNKRGHFIALLPLTSCRPDLNLDSVHYPMIVSVAMFDLWISNLCSADLHQTST